jgi:hypothetical protein
MLALLDGGLISCWRTLCRPYRGYLIIAGTIYPPLPPPQRAQGRRTPGTPVPRWATLFRPSGTSGNTKLAKFSLPAFVAGFLACALLAGCAAPGEPTAPHPVVPVAVADLSVHQSGNSNILTFTVPRQLSNHEALTELPALEIYRVPLPAGATPDKKTPWRLVYAVPSERTDSYLRGDTIEFRDPLSADDLSQGTGALVAYKVRTRTSQRAASADSNIVTARIFPAPAPPRDIRATETETAIQLSWMPPEGAPPTGYRVYRAEVESAAPGSAPDISKLVSPAEMIGPATAPQFSDSHFDFGKTYLYTVRAITQTGPDAVESEDSAPAVIAARDIFPPAPPTGLEALIIPATNQVGPGVELSWAISPEADVAGYHVYRGEQSDTAGEPLNQEMLPSPAFRDISVMAGKSYFYRVTATDRAGNESAPSAAIQIDTPATVP